MQDTLFNRSQNDEVLAFIAQMFDIIECNLLIFPLAFKKPTMLKGEHISPNNFLYLSQHIKLIKIKGIPQ